MTEPRRLLLGILLGAAGGSGLVAGIIFALPEEHGLHSPTAEPLVRFLRFVVNDLNLNSEHFLIGSGAVIGAVTGILLARVIPNEKKWLTTFLALVAGIMIGFVGMYFPSARWVDQISDLWAHTCEGERAWAILRSLEALDRATTNQIYLVNFQQNGREELTNYLREVESWHTNSFEFSPTESATYKHAKKYLAAHS